jgi:hypothetical protein
MVIAAGSASLWLNSRIRLMGSARPFHSRPPDADRYRPMLRLLSDEDLNFTPANSALRKKIRAQRREVFRGYLRCLTRDYALLLAGIRAIMVESNIERPDLTKALARNRIMFVLALCRIEANLQLHALGIGTVDVSGLVEALGALKGFATAMTPAAGSAY